MKKVSGILQLSALMLTHFFADMMGGVLAGILPATRGHFDLSLKLGIIFLATRAISSNFFQIVIGSMRKRSKEPFFLYIGLILLMLLGVLGFLPKNTPFWLLIIFATLFGIGTAAVHPEGLRGAMGVNDINIPTATSLFMLVGFLGFSTGPLVGALLVEELGFESLGLLIIPLIGVIICLYFSKIVLVTDRQKPKGSDNVNVADYSWSFPQLFFIAVLLNTGATILQSLLPSFLNSHGFTLKFGGMMALLFGLGSAIGSLGGGILTKKYSIPNIVLAGMSIGIPILILYIALFQYMWSGILIFLAGLFVSSSLPLLVVLARFAKTRLTIGVKMGIMVGGSWGTAAVVFLLLSGPIAHFGLDKAIKLVVSFYILALCFAYLSKRRTRG